MQKISNTEWGLVIGALAVIDLIQFLLDLLFEIGVIVNRFIDIGVGMALPFYLHMRGQNVADTKRLTGLVGTFLVEQIPDVDALPLWSLDGIFNWRLYKAEEKAEREREAKESQALEETAREETRRRLRMRQEMHGEPEK